VHRRADGLLAPTAAERDICTGSRKLTSEIIGAALGRFAGKQAEHGQLPMMVIRFPEALQ
jgi:hypothetical protein